MKKKSEMDDILNEFSTDFRVTGDKVLELYVREYPELTEALYEHAGVARAFRHLPEAEMSTEEEELRTLKSVSLVQNLLHELRTHPIEHVMEYEGKEMSNFICEYCNTEINEMRKYRRRVMVVPTKTIKEI